MTGALGNENIASQNRSKFITIELRGQSHVLMQVKNLRGGVCADSFSKGRRRCVTTI